MNRLEWINKCNHWKQKWPDIESINTTSSNQSPLNLYAVLEAVNNYSYHDYSIVGDAGSISYAGPVALKSKQDQRFIFSPAQADMGWAIPGAIGVAMASNTPVIAITGDGSFMSNVQELAVIKQYNLNIKILILNNQGYLSIKNTQEKYFDGRVYGTSNQTGLWFPDFSKVADSYELPYLVIDESNKLNLLVDEFSRIGPVIVNCVCMQNQEILPAQALKNGKQAGLHDMTPFLSDEELYAEMIEKID
jgi:acetolactate synthase-1/2/3 large subunit